MSTHHITFEPTDLSVDVPAGTTVVEAARMAGISIDTPCDGAGTCGKCRVRFTSGAPTAGAEDRAVFTDEQQTAGWRLACQTELHHDALIAIPDSSLLDQSLQILTDTDGTDDLPEADGGPSPLASVAGQRNVAIAVDVGTTTLVAEMIDLPSGEELAVAAALNPQVVFGDDVISRIGRAKESPAQAAELQEIVIDAMNALIGQLCEQAGVSADVVRGISFAGNTTMQHLLAGWSVENLAHLPFESSHPEAWTGPATELGLQLPNAEAYILPVIGGFVGGDTMAGVLSAELLEARDVTVMIDIGTNGEIVVTGGGRTVAASAAAGPAFEGARIEHGMRAIPGAIEHIQFTDDVEFTTLGGEPAVGICGSALIDIAAELLQAGLIDETGRMVDDNEIPAATPEAISCRLRDGASVQREFLLAAGREGQADITLTQKDIRELQLATGAIRASVMILLQQLELTPADVKEVLLAGGFGSYLVPANAQRIGLLCSEFDLDAVRCVGNISLNGARWTLLSQTARDECTHIAETVEHVELSADPWFQMAFADAMLFPVI